MLTTIKRNDGYACLFIYIIPDFFTCTGISTEPMLWSKNYPYVNPEFPKCIYKVGLTNHGGLVGKKPNLFSTYHWNIYRYPFCCRNNPWLSTLGWIIVIFLLS